MWKCVLLFFICSIFQYINLQNLTIGNLAYERADGEYAPLTVCQEFYRNSSIDPENETFDVDPHIEKGTKAQNEHIILIYLWYRLINSYEMHV